MRIAVQIFGFLLLIVSVALLRVAWVTGSAGERAIAIGAGVLLHATGWGLFYLGRRYYAMVDAGQREGRAVMPLGRIVASFGALGMIWLYNLAILAALVVLTVRLL